VAVATNLSLKACNLWTKNELLRLENPIDRRAYFFPQRDVLRLQIQQRNFHE
jgi:hypothetical protein